MAVVEFMRATPDPRPGCDGEWWAGGILDITVPWAYDPRRVEDKGRKPVFVLWVEYLEDLQGAACNLESHELLEHFYRATELPIRELLDTSRARASEDWKEAIEEWERLNTL